MLHNVCERNLCNLHSAETTDRAFVYGPSNDVLWGVGFGLETFSGKHLDIPFVFFSDRNIYLIMYGGCISGKKFFSMSDLFCSEHNNPETHFRFRITDFLRQFPGKIKNGSHIEPVPLLNYPIFPLNLP